MVISGSAVEGLFGMTSSGTCACYAESNYVWLVLVGILIVFIPILTAFRNG